MDLNGILHKHNLKSTGCREGILSVIYNAGHPLSENEIREKLGGNYDRTTFYRSFKTLRENSIIHKIVIDNQLVKYALDNTVTSKQSHVHFYCETCESVKCLDMVPAGIPELPEGFLAYKTEIIIKGCCNICNAQNK